MRAERLANGNLLVPMRAETDGVIGDGMIEVGPEHPLFDVYAGEALGPIDLDAYGNEDWIKGRGSDFPFESLAERRAYLDRLGWTAEEFKALTIFRGALESGDYPWLADLYKAGASGW